MTSLALALLLAQASHLPHVLLTDEQGASVALDALRGQPVVLTMGYSKCKTRCPMIIGAMKKIEATFVSAGQPVQLVQVSLDPRNDTPEKLEATKQARGLSERWHLYAATDAQSKALADTLGLKFARDDEHVDHEAKVFVFAADGRLVASYSGWKFDPAEPLQRVTAR